MTDLDKAFEAKMAEKQNTSPAPMQQVDPDTGELITTDLAVSPVTVDTSGFDFDALESAEVGVSVVPVYWSPSEAGQKSRGFFQGFRTITKNEPSGQKDITVAMWLTREGLYMNGGAGFVKLFENVQEGTPIQLEYKGKEKTKSGHQVNTFRLNILNM